MATVAAIFGDELALERAIDALEAAGLGGDILQIEEGREDDSSPEVSENPDDTLTVPPIAAASGSVLGGGGIGEQGSTPFFGALFGAGNAALERLDNLGDAAEPFRRAVEQGGKVVILETGKVDEAVETLQRAGAQHLYDPR